MSRSHHGGPVWVRVIRDPALLLLTPADVHRALAGSPDPFASDPKPKRDGMAAFQPDAVTISRGETWRKRRSFNETVIDGAFAAAAPRFATSPAPRSKLLAGDDEIDWERWSGAFRRIARRVILGDDAADDDALSETLAEMMSEANGMPGEPSKRYPGFIGRLGEYVAAADPASLVGQFPGAPADVDTKPVGQVAHWLFATGDTLAINAFRALALLAADPATQVRAVGDDAYLDATLEEAMRLWPTTTMLSRETVGATEWGGETVPEGTQVLIPNTFLHRDSDRFESADRFAPEQWLSGEAETEWSFNHFSRGPQGCPGVSLSLLLGRSALGAAIAGAPIELAGPALDLSRPLPHMLDFFSIRVRAGGG